ncbi:hypothetical protein L195_g051572 [Trifolium pratense]|uniref:Uncharacterized protein n=1 Tax=Trifolium pratense TaxID=57577 RepID=A0A2K3K0I5_TRIPR|nr:hypothetical protein L195_g051572 [Trifolium pratense]
MLVLGHHEVAAWGIIHIGFKNNSTTTLLNETRRLTTCQEDFRYKESVQPFIEPGSDTTVGSRGSSRGIIHIGLKNNSTSELDTTLLPKTLRC